MHMPSFRPRRPLSASRARCRGNGHREPPYSSSPSSSVPDSSAVEGWKSVPSMILPSSSQPVGADFIPVMTASATPAAPGPTLSPIARLLANGEAKAMSPGSLALSTMQHPGTYHGAQTRGQAIRRRPEDAWPTAHYEQLEEDASYPPFMQGPITRKYRALLIGIGYKNCDFLEHLRGAVTDVQEMLALVVGPMGYRPGDVRVLCDETVVGINGIGIEAPTKMNIFEALTWLMTDADQGDACFFFFAGHGHHVPDTSGDEPSGMDQVIYPSAITKAGCIVDDHIHERLVRGVAPGVCLTAVVDACMSGTILDLPFEYQYPEVSDEISGQRLCSRPVQGSDAANFVTFESLSHQHAPDRSRAVMTSEGYVPRFRRNDRKGIGSVVLFSGSADSQPAADAPIDNLPETMTSMGVFTHSFVTEVKQMFENGEALSYGALLDAVKGSVVSRIRELWGGRVSQVPQLSSSHPFDIYETQFMI